MADANPFLKYAQPAAIDEAQSNNPFLRYTIRRPDAADDEVKGPSESTPEQVQAVDTNVVADVAKSAGIGLAEGGLGLVTLPGNLEALGRLGIDKGASLLGFENPELEKNNFLPTYNDAKGAVEKYTGKFYEPQTTAGEYARTIGEFAPMAAVGGPEVGLAARAANVLAPALTSETAGQITKGTPYEPVARAIGGLAGPSVLTGGLRAVSPAAPLEADAVRAGHVAELRAQGVHDLDAGQVTGSDRLKRANFAAQKQNFGPGDARAVRAQQQFNRAVSRSFGEDTPRVTPDVINQAHTRIGGVMDAVAQRTNIAPDNQLAADSGRILQNYLDDTNEASRIPRVTAYQRDIENYAKTGMNGEQFQVLRRNMNRSRQQFLRSNPEAANAIGDMMDSLDAALARHANPADTAILQHARTQYRNLMSTQKVVDSVGEQAALGHVSPSKLFSATKARISQNTAARGNDPLHELSRAGMAVLAPVKTSGTAENTLAIHAFREAPWAIGAELAGSALGAPGVGLTVAATKAALPGLLGRAWMSGPMQRYLANEAALPALRTLDDGAPGYLGSLPRYAPSLSSILRGGSGPRYDERGNLRPGQ